MEQAPPEPDPRIEIVPESPSGADDFMWDDNLRSSMESMAQWTRNHVDG
jgi:hypothetical protein